MYLANKQLWCSRAVPPADTELKVITADRFPLTLVGRNQDQEKTTLFLGGVSVSRGNNSCEHGGSNPEGAVATQAMCHWKGLPVYTPQSGKVVLSPGDVSRQMSRETSRSTVLLLLRV